MTWLLRGVGNIEHRQRLAELGLGHGTRAVGVESAKQVDDGLCLLDNGSLQEHRDRNARSCRRVDLLGLLIVGGRLLEPRGCATPAGGLYYDIRCDTVLSCSPPARAEGVQHTHTCT